MTRPTTRIAYCANAIRLPAGRLASGSSAPSPGASPDASCHAEGSSPRFFFFPSDSAATDESFSVLTTAHEPPAVADAAAGSRGATGSVAGAGAGVQDGSLGALGVGSGAG